MAAPMIRTRHPGIYKRGSRYVVRFRANGKRPLRDPPEPLKRR